MHSPQDSLIATEQPHVAVASKVPAATMHFWLIKVLTTGMGETTSDYLLHRVKPRLLILAATGLAFVAALAVQMLSRRYHAARYWMVAILVAIFGTMVADVIAKHLSLTMSTAAFAVLLAAALSAWKAVEGTLSIHSIFNARREAFYWSVVFFTFVLGTAVGDFTADVLHLGFLGSGVMFLGLIALPYLGFRLLKLNGVACFWAAYILTRPLGASFADWMAANPRYGGLGWGPAKVSLLWAAAILAIVVWLAVRREPDLPTEDPATDRV